MWTEQSQLHWMKARYTGISSLVYVIISCFDRLTSIC